MDPKTNQSLPFLTRNMLSFENGTVFSLRIRSKSLSAAVISIRGLTREGPFKFSHTLVSTGVEQTETFRIPDVPIMLSVVDESNFVTQGRDFIILDLMVNGDKYYEYFAGPVYQAKGLSWPATNTRDKVPNGGFITDVTGSNPAAGAEISVTVPTNEVWKFIGLTAQLVTDANVANRRVQLEFASGSGAWARCLSSVDQAASNFKNYAFQATPHALTENVGNQISIAVPKDLILVAGDIINTWTVNIQAGDNWGAPLLRVEKFFT